MRTIETPRRAGTPDSSPSRLNQAVEPFHTSPEQFGTLIRTELEKWAKVIKAGAIKID